MELIQANHNFDQVTVLDIAERAGVNRATFYAHFEDKYALLDDFVAQAFQSKLAGYLPPDHSGVVGVHVLVRVTCELLDEMLGTCPPSTQAQHGGLMMRQLQHNIKAAVRADLGQTESNPRRDELAVTFRSWAVFGAAFDWMQSPRRVPAETLADEVAALLRAGMTDAAVCAGDAAPPQPRLATAAAS